LVEDEIRLAPGEGLKPNERRARYAKGRPWEAASRVS
jgi:hypothetical protein